MDTKQRFTLFFNFNDEDHYLVEYLSQYFRDRGMTTFDRSVDQLPDAPEFAISEDDALDQSSTVIAVLTENSVEDPSFINLVDRAEKAGKPLIVMRFDSAVIPTPLVGRTLVESDREHYTRALSEVEKLL